MIFHNLIGKIIMTTDPTLDPLELFETELRELIIKTFEHMNIARPIDLEIPPEGKGDFALPCFSLAPVLKKSPPEIAKELVEIFSNIAGESNISKVEAENAYVNFYINPERLKEVTVNTILKLQDKYGQLSEKGIKIILEHTSANPTDKLHVGRARNPIIGDSLGRILRWAGYKVETQYYVDDMGKQAARKILESRYPDWDRERFKTGYQWATSATSVSSDYYELTKEEELNQIMEGLERGDPKMLEEAEKICNNTMNELIIPSLERINIKIDNYVNESRFMRDNSVTEVME